MADPALAPEVKTAIDTACEALLSTDDVPTEPLWHYCGADGCEGIVAKDEIFATHYGFTNDTEELQRGERLVKEVVDRLAQSEPDTDKRSLYALLANSLPGQQLTDLADVYLACFTAAPSANELTQWSGYGHRGTGYAIQLALQVAKDTPDAPLAVLLAKVVYDDQVFRNTVERQLGLYADLYKQQISAGTRALIGVWMMRECAALSPRLKHSCFDHENEWRLIVSPLTDNPAELVCFRRREKNNLVPYIKVALGRAVRLLVAGPAHAGEERARLAACKMLLVKHGYDPSMAELSAIPFRA